MVACRVGDIVDFNPRTSLPREGELPFIDMGALSTSGRAIGAFGKRRVGSGGSRFRNGDTLLARITPCLENGKGGQVSGLAGDGVAQGSTEFIVMRAKNSRDEAFVYYLSRRPDFRAHAIRQMSGTSGRQRVAWQALTDFEIQALSPDRRHVVGAILSALDDKIELNRRMNETLEASARALFRDWFVDFGPTRAKAEGRPAYLAPDLWSLFPDRLGDDGVPEGWEWGTLGNLANIQNGFAFSSRDWTDGGVPVVKIGSIKPGLVDLSQVSFVSQELAAERAAFRLGAGDMLVGLTGYVGETGFVPPAPCLPMINQRVGRILPVKGAVAYVFCALRDPDFKDYAVSKSHGSAQANVSTKSLLEYPLPMTDAALMKHFQELVMLKFDRIITNLGESRTLAETRDALLPKLMSGAIRVREAGARAEAP